MWLETQKGVLVNLDSLEYILTEKYSKGGTIYATNRRGRDVILGKYETEKDLDYAFIWLREYFKENQLLLPLSME
jgi:hypothetical protein